ncbi:MAG: UDP-4-amino-4,6-dideoxy-N-acetyl-beta-L-altrosamine transaminase [Synergistaceae bacterium]|nr:UDP-4-amino-4,6-dideoxy-N-acetyl-beta-L-altrosamine transaminase [Synergistaceae bacterium]MBQ3759727.1 UDP-4-amino-4,6-dideoxy-N-acetyl-beta-L-altrosamine transaminase [Synergistaceae bacterium]MBQ4400852.1 UDP-4-amino-4,6-dideoxy-N-acetyl-beta-L-altrosamine transaminase [Synergistaceae bacterium]MBQ6115115.1 UDP-4-amino-4,6-dideoxy-N-acetyl-beta-L-altrosamine transaminase [Synergistaceae bacterium]MBR0248282.1 UDP-4-amino-4,6-dideoxy-N-acetyl-beta-L-altrosamine transaminase [Synergistaceae
MKTLSYGRQWINDDDIAEVVKVLRGDWLTMGPTVDAFEKSLADYAGVKHAVTFSSGTAALHGAMYASGMGAGDFAVTTAMTFVATSNSVIYTGATPIFADIDNTLCMNPEKAEESINAHGGKVKAVIPVSFGGYPFEIEPFREIAEEYNAVLIEDASHSWGGDRGSHKIGFDADMTTLSFHPVKHITTAEGGAVLTSNDEYARRLKMFRNHGTTRNASEFVDEPDGIWHSEMQDLGYNYRLSEVHCAIGLSQMKRLDEFVGRRREIARLYFRELSGVEGLTLPPGKEGHAWHLFIARVNEELHGQFFGYLRDNDIRLQVHYRPVPLQPYYRKKYGYKAGDFPEAEKYYRQAVSLPIFPLMTDDDVMRVCGVIKNFVWR